MTIVCVDDEPIVLSYIVTLCESLPEVACEGESVVKGFATGKELLAYLKEHPVDVALLDINLGDINGIALAAMIKELRPEVAIIFLTGYEEYALEAFSLHASGYLLKPISQERLSKEVSYALAGRAGGGRQSRIVVHTFGNFDMMVGDRTVFFSRNKAKELMAYLIDRNGGGVTRAEAFSILWEDREYDRNMQKQLDVVIRSLRHTLREYGISDVMEMSKGVLKIRPEKLDCDLYRFLDGDASVINSYRGEYMSNYSWAGMTEEYITRNANGGGRASLPIADKQI